MSDWSSYVCSSDLLEGEIGTQDFIAQEAGRASLLKRFFEALVDFENFAVYVVVAHRDAHGIRRNGHAFDHDMRIKAQDVAVFECARFAFVGVAHQVLLPRQRARHERSEEHTSELQSLMRIS